jgi:hypothetical protein
MALGEAHVLALTKRALGGAGVNVGALEAAAAASGKAAATQSIARSGSALLVKNLPYSASEAELQVFRLLLSWQSHFLFPPQEWHVVREHGSRQEKHGLHFSTCIAAAVLAGAGRNDDLSGTIDVRRTKFGRREACLRAGGVWALRPARAAGAAADADTCAG